jgi:hypothetical protein
MAIPTVIGMSLALVEWVCGVAVWNGAACWPGKPVAAWLGRLPWGRMTPWAMVCGGPGGPDDGPCPLSDMFGGGVLPVLGGRLR